MRCSPLADLAAVVFYAKPFDAVVLVDSFPGSLLCAGIPFTLDSTFILFESICTLGGALSASFSNIVGAVLGVKSLG